MEKMFKPKEAAEILSLKKLTIYRWVKAGKIKAVRLPDGRLRIAESELERVIKPHGK
jgi:excisionase family DNA binding protein